MLKMLKVLKGEAVKREWWLEGEWGIEGVGRREYILCS